MVQHPERGERHPHIHASSFEWTEMNVGSHCFGGHLLLPESCLLRNPLASSGAAGVHCLAMGVTILDITDDVWNALVSQCMAFLFLCVKLASKMDYQSSVLKQPSTWFECSIIHLVPGASHFFERKKGKILLWLLFLFSSCCFSFRCSKGLHKHRRKAPMVLPNI